MDRHSTATTDWSLQRILTARFGTLPETVDPLDVNLRPDVVLWTEHVGGVRQGMVFELKPVTYENRREIAEAQLNRYVASDPQHLRRAGTIDLFPEGWGKGGMYLGEILTNDEKVYKMYIYNTTTPGLILYRLDLTQYTPEEYHQHQRQATIEKYKGFEGLKNLLEDLGGLRGRSRLPGGRGPRSLPRPEAEPIPAPAPVERIPER